MVVEAHLHLFNLGRMPTLCQALCWAHLPIILFNLQGKHSHTHSTNGETKAQGGWRAAELGFQAWSDSECSHFPLLCHVDLSSWDSGRGHRCAHG